MNGTKIMSEPPKGVVAGEDVPRENEDKYSEKDIDEAVAVLRKIDAYKNKREKELREIAKRRLM